MRLIYFDETSIGVGQRLADLSAAIVYPGHRDWPIRPGEDDEVWLRCIATGDHLAITRDKQILRRPREREALVEHDCRVIVMTMRDEGIDSQERILRDRWAEVEGVRLAPPARYRLNRTGLHGMSF